MGEPSADFNVPSNLITFMKKFICIVCNQANHPTKKACLTRCCQQRFCANCIAETFKENRSIECPTCTERLRVEDLQEDNQCFQACNNIMGTTFSWFDHGAEINKGQPKNIRADATSKVSDWLKHTLTIQEDAGNGFTQDEEKSLDNGLSKRLKQRHSKNKFFKSTANVSATQQVDETQSPGEVTNPYEFIPSQKVAEAVPRRNRLEKIHTYKSNVKRMSAVGDIEVDMYDDFDKVRLGEMKRIAGKPREDEEYDSDKNDGDFSNGSSDNWSPSKIKKTKGKLPPIATKLRKKSRGLPSEIDAQDESSEGSTLRVVKRKSARLREEGTPPQKEVKRPQKTEEGTSPQRETKRPKKSEEGKVLLQAEVLALKKQPNSSVVSPGWGRANRVSKELNNKRPKINALNVSTHRSVAIDVTKLTTPTKPVLKTSPRSAASQKFCNINETTSDVEAWPHAQDISSTSNFNGFGVDMVITPKKEILDEIIRIETREVGRCMDELDVETDKVCDPIRPTQNIEAGNFSENDQEKYLKSDKVRRRSSEVRLPTTDQPDALQSVAHDKQVPVKLNESEPRQVGRSSPSDDSGVHSKSTVMDDLHLLPNDPKRKTFSLSVNTQDLTSTVDHSQLTQEKLSTIASGSIETHSDSKPQRARRHRNQRNNHHPKVFALDDRRYYFISAKSDPETNLLSDLKVELETPRKIVDKFVDVMGPRMITVTPQDEIVRLFANIEKQYDSETSKVINLDTKEIGIQTENDVTIETKVVQTLDRASQTCEMVELETLGESSPLTPVRSHSNFGDECESAIQFNETLEPDGHESQGHIKEQVDVPYKNLPKMTIAKSSIPINMEFTPVLTAEGLDNSPQTNKQAIIKHFIPKERRVFTQYDVPVAQDVRQSVLQENIVIKLSARAENANDKPVDKELLKVYANVLADLPKRAEAADDETILINSQASQPRYHTSSNKFSDHSSPRSESSICNDTLMTTQVVLQREASIANLKGEINRLSLGFPDVLQSPPPEVKIENNGSDDDVDYIESTPQLVEPASKSFDSRPLCFAMTSLSPDAKARVKRLAEIVCADMTDNIEDFAQITHLINMATPKNRATKTLKYIMAVAHKKWVLPMSWVDQCLAKGQLVSEAKYEMPDSNGGDGPHRSRCSALPVFGHRRFQFCILEAGPPDVPFDYLKMLLRIGGAHICDSVEAFDRRMHCVVLTQDECTLDTLQDIPCQKGLLAVTCHWAIACIERCKLLPVFKYYPSSYDYSKSLEERLKLIYPNELFEENGDEDSEEEEEEDND